MRDLSVLPDLLRHELHYPVPVLLGVRHAVLNVYLIAVPANSAPKRRVHAAQVYNVSGSYKNEIARNGLSADYGARRKLALASDAVPFVLHRSKELLLRLRAQGAYLVKE